MATPILKVPIDSASNADVDALYKAFRVKLVELEANPLIDKELLAMMRALFFFHFGSL